MTSATLNAAPQAQRQNRADPWVFVDATLLVLTLVVSSDLLIQIPIVQQLVWMICYALTLLRIAVLWPYFLALALRNKVVFVYPLVCLASVLWSYSPVETLVTGVQLTMTMIIAMYVGWRYSLTALFKALVIVLSIAFILSLLHWAVGVFPWPANQTAGGLAGLFSSKNQLGQRTMFFVIAALTIWILPRSVASGPFKLALAVAMLLALIALVLSRSATSILMTPVLVAIWLLLCRRWLPRSLVIPLAGLGLVIAALGPLLLSLYGIDPVSTLLGAMGKSSTLTGRTILWEIGLDVSSRHPILGVGYNSFWYAPEFFNERLATQHAGAVTSKSFHNFLVEILVSAGWPGLIAMLSLVLATAHRLFRLYADFNSATAAGGLVMWVTIIVASLAGTSLYRGHEAMIVLLVALAVSSQEDYLARLSQARTAYDPHA